MNLKNSSLFQSGAFINNEWITGEKRSFKVYNPANGEVVANVAECGEAETIAAINAASIAFKGWRAQTAKDRSDILKKWFKLITDNADDLAQMMTTEQGKPLSEAKGEVTYGASFVEWFAEEARRVYGDIIPSPVGSKRMLTIKQPIGVVAAITPWNFPISMITRKISPALAAGCTVVIKPPSETPLCALALTYLAQQAGFPAGVINVVPTSNSKLVGKILTTHPKVKKISFTGSTEVGKLLMEQAASTLKKVSLELGGNAPTIIFNDADIDIAVKGTMASKYRNAGQTCVCTNRIFVEAGIYQSFIKAYVAATQKLKIGNGLKDDVDIGPLISKHAVEKVERLVADAVEKGGIVTFGGKIIEQGSLYFEPTIIENCNATMDMHREEIFGPVSAIYKFDTEQQVINMANDTEYGLAAYFFTNDINRLWRVSEALEYGIIGVNEGIISHAEAPFGGVKESGMGREGSKYGIEDYLEIKYICIGGL